MEIRQTGVLDLEVLQLAFDNMKQTDSYRRTRVKNGIICAVALVLGLAALLFHPFGGSTDSVLGVIFLAAAVLFGTLFFGYDELNWAGMQRAGGRVAGTDPEYVLNDEGISAHTGDEDGEEDARYDWKEVTVRDHPNCLELYVAARGSSMVLKKNLMTPEEIDWVLSHKNKKRK